MRRTVLLVVAVLTLAVVFTAPATAAPTKAFTWAITCPVHGSFEVVAKGTPGFPLEGGTPVLLLGGTFTYTPEGGASETWEVPPPPGLVPRLETCVVSGPLETGVGFTFRVDPAYLFFPGQ